MSDQKKPHPHSGHRERLKKQFLERGAHGFHEHQVLELLLFYAIPQKDTNPLAHALLDRFGSLFGVMKASREELMSVSGVGGHTADFIWDFSCFAANILEKTPPKLPRYDHFPKVGKFLLSHYENQTGHLVTMLLLNNRHELISHETVANCSIHSAQLHPDKFVRLVLSKNAAMVIVAHSHPGEIAVETEEDRIITRLLAERFRLLDIPFLEHYLVVGHRYIGLLQQSLSTLNSAELSDFHRGGRLDYRPFYADTLFPSRRFSAGGTERSPYSELLAQGTNVLVSLTRLLSYAYAGRVQRAEQVAIELLQRYDDDLQVICAEPLDKLSPICGGDHAATLLKTVLPAYGFAYMHADMEKGVLTMQEAGNVFVHRYIGVMRETVMLLLLDGELRKLDLICVGEGSVNAANFNMRRLTELAYREGACYAILAHNHPFGIAYPSFADLQVSQLLAQALEMVNCQLLEHFVVAGNQYLPILLDSHGEIQLQTSPEIFYGEQGRQWLLKKEAGRY